MVFFTILLVPWYKFKGLEGETSLQQRKDVTNAQIYTLTKYPLYSTIFSSGSHHNMSNQTPSTLISPLPNEHLPKCIPSPPVSLHKRLLFLSLKPRTDSSYPPPLFLLELQKHCFHHYLYFLICLTSQRAEVSSYRNPVEGVSK